MIQSAHQVRHQIFGLARATQRAWRKGIASFGCRRLGPIQSDPYDRLPYARGNV